MSTQFAIVVGIVPCLAAEAGMLWMFDIVEYSITYAVEGDGVFYEWMGRGNEKNGELL